jgi:transcription termination/antitermination protein NusA
VKGNFHARFLGGRGRVNRLRLSGRKHTMNTGSSEEGQAIRRLFAKHVPEVAAGTIEIRGIARRPGERSIVVVSSKQSSLDTVGACVGLRGDRVKPMVAELSGEMIDIVRWEDSLERFTANLLAPMHFVRVSCDQATLQVTAILALDSTQSAPDVVALRAELLLLLTGWTLKLEMPNER